MATETDSDAGVVEDATVSDTETSEIGIDAGVDATTDGGI
jgi:hypothetical protein